MGELVWPPSFGRGPDPCPHTLQEVKGPQHSTTLPGTSLGHLGPSSKVGTTLGAEVSWAPLRDRVIREKLPLSTTEPGAGKGLSHPHPSTNESHLVPEDQAQDKVYRHTLQVETQGSVASVKSNLECV